MIKLLILLINLNCYGQMPIQTTNAINIVAFWYQVFDTNVTGYYFYNGTNKIDCGTTTYCYYSYTGCPPVIAVSAYYADKVESPLCYMSNGITPVKMMTLKLNHPCAIGSTNMQDWYPITNVLVPCDKQQEFFRVVQ